MYLTRSCALILVCLPTAAHSAVYARHHQQDTLEPSTAAPKYLIERSSIALKPPEFVARGFLEQNHNRNAPNANPLHPTLQMPRQARDISDIKDKCRKSCGSVVELACVPECQVMTFACLDYDRKSKAGEAEYQECERTTLSTYDKYSKDWEATHPRLVGLLAKKDRKHVESISVHSHEDDCKEACGKGVDSSCATECQVRMYQCVDFDKLTPEGKKKYEACKEKVMEEYEAFAADWNATHPYLLAIGRHVSAKQLLMARDRCAVGCRHNSGISCTPRCEVSSYSCFSADDVQASDSSLESCMGKVITETTSKDTDLSIGQSKDIENACRSSCGLGADCSCAAECQIQMYACSGSGKHTQNSKDEANQYQACTRSVLSRYETFAVKWNKAHPNLLSIHGHADAVDLDELHDECEEACGPSVDATCIPECEVKIYSCLDLKHPDDTTEYKKCVRETLASYEHFADDWDASHPYLLAVRKHVSEAELFRIQEKCDAVCGKGVESTCVPECQVALYTCLDHDQKTADGAKLYDTCESSVVARLH